MTNAGVGPGKMQGVQNRLNGVAIRNNAQRLTAMSVPATTPISRNFISRRVLRPDETVVMFSISDATVMGKRLAAMCAPQNAINYCYGSIFESR